MPSYWDANGNLVDGRFALSGSNAAEGIADFRLNTQGTLLASAARTAIVASANQTNYNARGLSVHLEVTTASGTGGLTVRLRSIDPASGNFFSLNAAPTAITATGSYVFMLYPGISGGSATQATSLALPRTWYVVVGHGDATSYTYSLSYSLIL